MILKPFFSAKIKPFLVVCGIIVTSFVYLLSVSWLRWGNLIIDTSRELWVPYKILNGAVLYKDIFYLFGFFVPYFISFLYRLFGVNLYILVWLGVSVTVLMSATIYKICRLFLDELVSGLAVLTFLFVFAFGAYVSSAIFNFILPYSFSSTIAILFISISLYHFLKFISSDKKKDLFIWSIFLSLAFFCRPESSFVAWTGFAIIAAIIMVKEQYKGCLKTALYIFLPLIIALSGYGIFLWKNSAFAGFKESIIDVIRFELFKSEFTRNTAGSNTVLKNSILMLRSFFFHLMVILLLAAGSASISRYRSSKKSIDVYTGSAALLIAAALCRDFLQRSLPVFIDSQYRCIPIILIMGMLLFFVRVVRNTISFKKDLSLLTLFVLSFLTALRILFNTNPLRYGFCLLSLSLICYFIFFLKILKDFLIHRLKVSEPLFATLLIIFFTFSITPYWMLSSRVYGSKDLKVMTNRGDIVYWSTVAFRFWGADKYLLENTAKNDKVVIFPEGVSLNFFSDRDNPLKYYHFLPYDIERMGDENIISQLVSYNVKYIVIVNRKTDEYAASWFGVDYGKKLYSWICNNYDVVEEFGPRPSGKTGEFGIVILKKR